MPKKAGSVLNPASPQKTSKKVKKIGKEPPLYNYEAIAHSPEFVALKKKKRNFIVPITIFFLLFYISLPILTSYTTILNKPAIGDITWVWVFALAQFIMTWTLCMIYVRKAEGFDKDAEEIIEKEKAGDYV